MLTLAASAADQPGLALRNRLAGFAGYLRANGFGLAAGDAIRVLETARRTGVGEPDLLRWSFKALLCGRGDEWRRFDALFDSYFLPPTRSRFESGRGGTPGRAEIGASAGDAALPLPLASGEAGAEAADGESERHGASREESRAGADFNNLDRTEQARGIEALMRRFARRLKQLRLRREARFAHGRRLDLRATIRRSVPSGGTPLRLAWTDRRRVRPRLVLLLDVSRSMSACSFFYLRLARALCAELEDVHCFIFHTRLVSVADALRDPDPWRSQERLHLLSEGWAGGTRIGECLAEFNRGQGRRLVHSRTGLIIVSDGYDTGAPELLAGELCALRRRARRLVWLNPLLGRPGYSPESRAMQAALPHLDAFQGGADLAALERGLPALLAALG